MPLTRPAEKGAQSCGPDKIRLRCAVNGGVAEWSIAPVLKTGEPQGSVGSNPTPSATFSSMPPSPEPPRSSIRRKIVFGFGLVLVMLGIIGVISYRSTLVFISTARSVAHTREVMEIQERTQRHLME